MQIVKLELIHINFYCPVTGIFLQCGDGEYADSPALKAQWISIMPEHPEYLAPELVPFWHDYLNSLDVNAIPNVTRFLESVVRPNWVAFECFFPSVPGDGIWYVIDMNYTVDALPPSNLETWH